MDRSQAYAPDTNFFFHAKTPGQLPWRELTDADRVELVVLDEVMRELDRHKANGNSRSAKRARAAFTVLDPLIYDNQEEVVVKASGPQVVWRLPPLLDPQRVRPANLDLATADGRIVEEALAVHKLLGNVSLLSNDRLAHRMATAVGLPSQKVPETWLLPPEADDRDKENAKLRDELRVLRDRDPRMDVQLLDEVGPIEKIEGSIRRHRPLSEDFIADALHTIELRHPEERSEIPGQVTVIVGDAKARYRQARNEWLDKVRECLERQPAALNFERGMLELQLEISNSGGATAEGLSVEVWVEGPMMLVNDKVRDKFFAPGPRLSLPDPPKLERYSFEMMRRPTFPDHLSRIHDFIAPMPQARDPQGFYWDYEGKDELLCNSAEGSCEDFRHHVHDVTLPIVLFLPQSETDEPRGCLHIRWSARNLPQAVVKKYPIRLAFDWQDSEAAVQQSLLEK